MVFELGDHGPHRHILLHTAEEFQTEQKRDSIFQTIFSFHIN